MYVCMYVCNALGFYLLTDWIGLGCMLYVQRKKERKKEMLLVRGWAGVLRFLKSGI